MKKKLLIFGAGGALGRGAVEVFLNKDYSSIYLFDRNNPEFSYSDERIITVKTGDLNLEDNVRRAFEEVKADKDALCFLFCTVGGFSAGKYIWETELRQWQNMMDINLTTSFLIAKYFSLLVKDSAGGSICFTSAMSGLDIETKRAGYSVSKNALNYLVRILALEGRNINLSANVVAPHAIDTPANREWVKNPDSMTRPAEIGEIVHGLFTNFKAISGSIITLPERLMF